MTSSVRNSLTNSRFLLLTALILVAALCRVVDHGLINVAPVGAMALFGGACFANRRAAFGVTFGAMLLSDLLLYAGRYSSFVEISWKSMSFVYVAFGLVVLLGSLLRQRRSVTSIVLGSLAGSLIFFLVSNVSAWLFCPDPVYPKTLAGLLECYWTAIPFIRGQSPLLNTIVGDAFFNAVLFGAWSLIESRVPAWRTQEGIA